MNTDFAWSPLLLKSLLLSLGPRDASSDPGVLPLPTTVVIRIIFSPRTPGRPCRAGSLGSLRITTALVTHMHTEEPALLYVARRATSGHAQA